MPIERSGHEIACAHRFTLWYTCMFILMWNEFWTFCRKLPFRQTLDSKISKDKFCAILTKNKLAKGKNCHWMAEPCEINKWSSFTQGLCVCICVFVFLCVCVLLFVFICSCVCVCLSLSFPLIWSQKMVLHAGLVAPPQLHCAKNVIYLFVSDLP